MALRKKNIFTHLESVSQQSSLVEQFLWDAAHIHTGSTQTPRRACRQTDGGEEEEAEEGGGGLREMQAEL